MFRDGLRAILSLEDEIEVVGEADDGRAGVELAHTLLPDIVVMDIGMRGLNGVEATRQIKANDPGVQVIALSTHSDRSYVLSMLEAGASSYVLKTAAFDEMCRAVRSVVEGKHYLSPDIAGVVVDTHVRSSLSRDGSAHEILGAREREILQLLAEGHRSPDIARRLHISTGTVESHRRNMMKKLDIHSIAELTKYAIREGLTPLNL
jgi:two-component system NarL family response regulator